jgi:DNA-binding GntR family transcriptional regulator
MSDTIAKPSRAAREGAPGSIYRVETEDLGRQVHKIIKSMIINGDLLSGQKLVQDELAERLGISRTPLQFALYKLEQEKLVETLPRRGFFVRRYSRKELLDIYEVRCRLEPLAARGAAINATDKEIAGLAELMGPFDDATAKADQKLLMQADYDFHMELVRCCGNQFLYDMLATFSIIIISNTRGLLKPAEVSSREHRVLHGALLARDPDRAERAMFDHIAGARANLAASDEYLVEGGA